MRLNPLVLPAALAGLGAVLGAFVYLMHRRLRAARGSIAALETELGLVKKRFEAATAGFHIRLLLLEKQAKTAAAAAAAPHFQASPSPVRVSEPHPMNRGEWDLRMKIRQLGQE